MRRSLWNAQPARDEFIGSAYVHSARIFDMLKSGGCLRYIGRPLILCRTDNDSFQASLGMVGRLLLDLNLVPIARAVFADRPEARELVIQLIERNHFREVLDWRLFAGKVGGKDAVARVRKACELFADRPGYRRTVFLLTLPAPALTAGLLVVRGVRRAGRALLGRGPTPAPGTISPHV